MKGVLAVGSEFLGLFVDDWGFALAILAWQAVILLCVRGLFCPARVSAVLFFAGLAAILIGSALRRGRTRPPG